MSINERSEGQKASGDALRADTEDGEDVSPLLAPFALPDSSGSVQ